MMLQFNIDGKISNYSPKHKKPSRNISDIPCLFRWLFYLSVFLFPVFYPLQTIHEAAFNSFSCRLVIFSAFQRIRKTQHVCQLFSGIMSVLISLAVIQTLHQIRHGIAYNQWYRFIKHLDRVQFSSFISYIQRIGLWSLFISGRSNQIQHLFAARDSDSRNLLRKS